MTRPGFALAELVIALLILQITIVATHRAMMSARDLISEAVRHEHALSAAEEVLDSLEWFGFRGPGVRNYGWGRVEWTGGGVPAEVTVDLFAPGAVVAYTQVVGVVPVAGSGS